MADPDPTDTRLLAPPGTVALSERMTVASADADATLRDSETDGAAAACLFTIRLEHRSKYTAMPKYSKEEWVPAGDFIFLIGEQRVLSVRVAEPEGAVATWEVTPIGAHSGTLKPSTGTGNQFDYTPQVTVQQRPITKSRVPNPAVAYQIVAKVTWNGQTLTAKETVKQDEKDIVRNEYVDFRIWREAVNAKGVLVHFSLHVPYRDRLIKASQPALLGNYSVVLDSAMTRLIADTERFYGGKVRITSGWRNPRRNLAAGSITVNSNHQHGGAVDVAPLNPGAPGSAARRKAFVILYKATKQVTARFAFVEESAKPLWAGAVPAGAGKGQTDADGDFIPDGSDLQALFNRANHVHLDCDAPDESEDD